MITIEFIRKEIQNQSYEISIHGDDERIADGLSIEEIEFVLSGCEIIEQYPDDERGKSCLAMGYLQNGKPVHTVCGKNRSGHLVIITVYLPSMPKWKNEYKRNK